MAVTLRNANIRKRPSTSSKRVKIIQKGNNIKIERCINKEWCRLIDGTYVAKFLISIEK
jgi:uncharacterized protein YraI